MIKIRNFVQSLSNGDKISGVAEISVSSTSELATEYGRYVFEEGSIAWDISTGDFYGLDENGTWYKQDGTGAYNADSNAIQSLSLNPALNLSIGDLNSPSAAPSSDHSESLLNIQDNNVILSETNITDDETSDEVYNDVLVEDINDADFEEDEHLEESEVYDNAEPVRDPESR